MLVFTCIYIANGIVHIMESFSCLFIINLSRSRCLRCVAQPPARSLPPNFSKVTNLTDLWTYVTCHSHPYSWACPRAVQQFMVVPQPPEPQASTSSVGALFFGGAWGYPVVGQASKQGQLRDWCFDCIKFSSTAALCMSWMVEPKLWVPWSSFAMLPQSKQAISG